MNFFKDIHCHCLPGVDDGPRNQAKAIELCKALIADGVNTVIATPHQLGRWEGSTQASEVRSCVEKLNELLVEKGLDLKVLPGGEVRIDPRIASLLSEDKINTLADNRKYLLLELPENCCIDITMLINQLSKSGVRIIIAHPERHSLVMKQNALLSSWADLGVIYQVTASALLGMCFLGSKVEIVSWRLLESMPCVVATDAHDLKTRKPMMKDAFHAISMRLGEKAARKLCIEMPNEIIAVR